MLALVALWLPVSVHCQLERLPGLEFLSCCDHAEATAPHQDDDCEGDGCAVVESGLYKIEERQATLPAPDLEAFDATLLSDPALTSADAGDAVCSTAPLELLASWRFSLRTALSPRAPSTVS